LKVIIFLFFNIVIIIIILLLLFSGFQPTGKTKPNLYAMVMLLLAVALLDHTHHGCPKCLLPREKLHPVKFMLAAGAYSWHP